MSGAKVNPIEMSDEDFAKLPVPTGSGEAAKPSDKVEDKQEEKPEDTPADPVIDPDNKPEAEDKQTNAEDKPEPVAEDGKESKPEPNSESEKETEPKPEDPAKAKPEAEPKPENKPEDKSAADAAVDHAAFYAEIMKPFKANGKMIELKSPEEVRQLMQMGANYTKKLQELQPHKKMLLMLQNNGLLDEGKLSYLIDLDKKNPEAVKKLIKDSGLDPLEIDTSAEPNYTPGNHTLSDQEVAFNARLEELVSTPEGTETLQIIDKTWDQTSKEALWDQPEIMSAIREQRENGTYDIIATELDRRKTLGTIPADMPFLKAYKVVGDDLTAQLKGKGTTAADNPTGDNKSKPEPKVLAVKAAEVKPEVVNNDKASAASITKASKAGAEKITNFLAESDEDFLKRMQGRL